MKTQIKVAVLCGILALAAAQGHAASAKTNWVQTLNFKLTVWEDGAVKPFTVTSKALVNALSGVATGPTLVTNGTSITTNDLPITFSSKATLIRRQFVGDTEEGSIRYLVRDSATDTDVSSFFGHTNIAAASVSSAFQITKHDIEQFSFDSPTISFSLRGLVQRIRAEPIGATSPVLKNLAAGLAGTGVFSNVSTNDAVVGGTLTVSGGRLE